MGDSYRIRTEIGINKTINVELDQKYNSLEILSLKIQQEDLYNQSCANYGVVIGRVTANNGFGIPNAKVSIFIPIQDQDVNRPEITSIYPYSSPEQKNEDGYRYNLLPYEQSYNGHTPTGTFPSIRDSLVDNTAIEIYDKYYKYTVKTNNSGDYMIMGVPLGVQVVFLDIDLSDIGEFSLTPQDLIRMGRATESQVSGRFFKSSSNLNSLPQIVSLTKSIDVSPLWGDPNTCQAAINRVDFDLRDDANIDIQPTAVFMGSLISSPETEKVKRRCKPTKKLGELCNLVGGPGQIISIRQTINNDFYGRPVLEQFRFDGGDDVIDENGAWLVDLPMNLDYVTINEFGERVFSNDPKIGIPTKAKYRFKIKWKQPEDLAQSTKRAYYLVPNVREYGWSGPTTDPTDSSKTSTQYEQFLNSYAFSLDWNDYGNTGTTTGRRIIQDAIDCEDKFYEFRYNQVYTVAGLIDLYQRGANKDRYIGIKNILNDTCESTNYKFPVNDSVKNRDILYTLLNVILAFSFFSFNFLIPVGHVLATIWPIFKILFFVVLVTIMYLIYFFCRLIDSIPFVSVSCTKPQNPKETWQKLKNPFMNIPLPMLVYPDCDFCECQPEEVNSDSPEQQSAEAIKAQNSLSCLINTTAGQDFSYFNQPEYYQADPVLKVQNLGNTSGIPGVQQGVEDNLLSGHFKPPDLTSYWQVRTPSFVNSPAPIGDGRPRFSQDITLSERINLFNTKGKYFNNSFGGGCNQIKVKINPTGNTGVNQVHYDNVMMLFIDPGCADQFITGQLISFSDFSKSSDLNVVSGRTISYLDREGNSVTSNGITGTAKNNSTVTLNYANPNNLGQTLSVTYAVPKTVDIDFSTKTFSSSQGQGDGETTFFDFFLDKKVLVGSATITATLSGGTVTLTDNGGGIMSGAGTSSFGTVDYDSGSFVLQFESPPLNNTPIFCNLTYFTQVGEQGANHFLIQKFPTDIEYFQVITATTYGNFVAQNPTVPNPTTANSYYWYNELTSRPPYQNFSFYYSLKYRFLDNFYTIWTQGNFSGGIGGIYNCNPYLPTSTYRPIYAIPDVKDYVVVFLMRGVDPHSARVETEVDLSLLYGHVYGTHKVRANLKFNIPIQPGLRLPRHNNIATTDTSDQGYIFYESFAYSPTNSFSSFTTNLVANYSALDASQIGVYNPAPNNSYNFTLGGTQVGSGNGYLTVRSTNGFAYGRYPQPTNSDVLGLVTYTPTQAVPTLVNNTSTPCPYCIAGQTIDLSSAGDRNHRGYYVGEPIEGGSLMFHTVDTNNQFSTISNYAYYSPVYPSGTTRTRFTSGTQRVVMRCDRLPTSTNRFVDPNNTQPSNNTEFVFQQNPNFGIFPVSDDGEFGSAYSPATDSYSSGDANEDENSQFETQIQTSFSCEGLVPLGCYDGSGENLSVKPKSDSCYDKITIKKGCFLLITIPIINLFKDFNTLSEFKGRFKVNFGACRGLFGHSFYNNWVNGVLFAYPFKNNRFFTSPTSSTPNQPYNIFCDEMIMFHSPTNNFYYRSSPYSITSTSGKFVGKQGPSNGRNVLNLLYPTTVTNLGPRDEFASQLTLSTDYFGYNMNKYSQTSYQDVENILNLFIISRLASSGPKGFFKGAFAAIGKYSINQFFNARRKNRVDGDYAQAISINSELGVDGFDFESYDFTSGAPGGNTFYLRNKTMGIFFSSDTQTRDYLSPRRIIVDDTTGLYDNLGFNSQVVPFYKWNIITSTDTIFGSERNEWATSSPDILNFRYQSMDRINATCDFYVGEIANIPKYSKGYIYNVAFDSTGQIIFEGDTRGGQTITNTGKIHVGAPYHFYFGLYRGKNAMDLFNKKYLGSETV